MSIGLGHIIFDEISRAKLGEVFFTRDFSKYGNPAAVRRALQRLTKEGKLHTKGVGIYFRPQIDSVVGPLTPSVDEVVKAIAKRKGFRVAPTGYYALNRLGMSTQVVMNHVYLTDGNVKTLRIGRARVKFYRTTSKNVSATGPTSHLAIQALKVIGKNNVTEKDIKHIQHVLTFETQDNIKHDIKLAPVWIQKIMQQAII